MDFAVKSACLRLLSLPREKTALLNSQLRQHVLVSPSSSRNKNRYPIPQLNRFLNFWCFASWSPKTSFMHSSKYKNSERPKRELRELQPCFCYVNLPTFAQLQETIIHEICTL